jgi:hypothetical protein
VEVVESPSEVLQPEVTVVVTGEPPEAAEEDLDYEEEEETSPEVIETLSLLDVLRVSAVMEDVIDQLSILGYIIPVQYERRQSLTQVSTHTSTHLVLFPLGLSVIGLPGPFNSAWKQHLYSK